MSRRRQSSKRFRTIRKKRRVARYARLAGQRQVFKAADALDRAFRYALAKDDDEGVVKKTHLTDDGTD
jgi:hypothetical protein